MNFDLSVNFLSIEITYIQLLILESNFIKLIFSFFKMIDREIYRLFTGS